jgi:thymidine phosphorylase
MLAETMIGIGKGMGKRVAALITDMDQPLGRAVGNALEVAESIETLKGRGPTDLESLSLELAAWMVHLSGVAASLDAARGQVRAALASGAGLERLRRVVELQGGDPRVCDDPSVLPRAGETVVVRSERDGRVARLAARAIGHAGMLLGAGRETVDGAIDPAVGFVFHKKVGDPVAVNEPIVTVHVGKSSRREEALARLREAIVVAPEAPPREALVLDVLA